MSGGWGTIFKPTVADTTTHKASQREDTIQRRVSGVSKSDIFYSTSAEIGEGNEHANCTKAGETNEGYLTCRGSGRSGGDEDVVDNTG